MTTIIRPRLRKPLGYALAGTALAVAWAVSGRHSWYLAIVIEVGVLAVAITTYLHAAADTDEGARAGSRADERQRMISLRSRALSCNVAAIAAFIGLVVAVAVKATWWWPFLVILAAVALTYGLGLSTYGVAEEDPADDASSPHRARSQSA